MRFAMIGLTAFALTAAASAQLLGADAAEANVTREAVVAEVDPGDGARTPADASIPVDDRAPAVTPATDSR